MMDVTGRGEAMEAARDLSHDLVSRDWQEYADACLCHDKADTSAVSHAPELAHEMVLTTVSTT
jgi:hypothetical protein